MGSFVPALILVIGGAAALALPARVRPMLLVAAFGLTVLQLVIFLDLNTTWETQWLGFALVPLRVDALSLAFGSVFAIIGVLGSIHALHMRDRGQQAAALFYGSGALGVVFAGDLLTLVVFWEVMAVASAYLIIQGGRPASRAAAVRYLFVHVVGGAILLAGVLWHFADTHSLLFEGFEGGGAAWLILIGFAVNAAIPPVHAWLADAYPEASASGAVFLSAFTTKTAVYVLLRGFAGWEILIIFGTAMALYGVVYAVLENDIRRLLAYHIISQVGFMVTAAGIGTHEAIEGATAHAFAHVLYKGLMIMATGAVMTATGTTKMTELGGLAPRMKVVFTLYMVGAFSISAVPLFAGFVSKSLVTEAAHYGGHDVAAFLLYVASVGTFLHTGLKLPYFTWLGSKRATPVALIAKVPAGMYVGMAGAAALCIGIGLFPQTFYDFVNFTGHYEPYNLNDVIQMVELLAFTGLGFWLMLAALKPKPTESLDTDWPYRHAARPVRALVQEPLERVFSAAERAKDAVVAWSTLAASSPETALQRLPLRDGVREAALVALSRQPLAAAIGALMLTFGVLIVVVVLRA